VGFDSLLHFYKSEHIQNNELSQALMQHTNWDPKKASPYVVACDPKLSSCLESEQVINGFTATNVGFYGPQSRSLRLAISDTHLQNRLSSFEHNGQVLTNLEMETAGIYGLAKLLGHRAISMNAILANRATHEFSSKPQEVVDDLIHYTLDRIAKI
jgi:uridine phosphorylase